MLLRGGDVSFVSWGWVRGIWVGREVSTMAVQAERDDGEDKLEGAKRKVEVKHCGVMCRVACDMWSWNVG